MGRLRGLVTTALASFIGAGVWHHWFWEAVRAWFYERGFHMLNPVLFGITAEQALHWGPTIAFLSVGGALFYKTWPRTPQTEMPEAIQPPPQSSAVLLAGKIERQQDALGLATKPRELAEKPRPTKYKNKRLLDVTPKFLMELYEERPKPNADILAKEYRGKWIMCSGNAENVSTYGSGMFYLSFELEGKLSMRRVVLRFDGAKWKDRLLILAKGQHLTVVGKIDDVEKFSVTLIDCEIVE